MKSAHVVALEAAHRAGGKVQVPEPAPQIDAAALAAKAIEAQRALLEQTEAAIARMGQTSATLTALFADTAASVEQLREAGTVPITAETLAAALQQFAASVGTRLDAIENQLAQIVGATGRMVILEQRIIGTLNQPVVAKYDDDGRVVSAHRVPVKD